MQSPPYGKYYTTIYSMKGECSLNLNHSSYSPGLGIVRRPSRRKASFFCSQTSSEVSFSSSRRVRS